jgi:hypothetical protein
MDPTLLSAIIAAAINLLGLILYHKTIAAPTAPTAPTALAPPAGPAAGMPGQPLLNLLQLWLSRIGQQQAPAAAPAVPPAVAAAAIADLLKSDPNTQKELAGLLAGGK